MVALGLDGKTAVMPLHMFMVRVRGSRMVQELFCDQDDGESELVYIRRMKSA